MVGGRSDTSRIRHFRPKSSEMARIVRAAQFRNSNSAIYDNPDNNRLE